MGELSSKIVGLVACVQGAEMIARDSPRFVMAVLLVMVVTGFAFTHWFTAYHRQLNASLAQRWFRRGDQAMAANYPAVAAEDYRNALAYAPGDHRDRLRLSEALLAGNHLNEARAHLISLWGEEPANGAVNLQLARLFARKGDAPSAIRYYRNAINGVWTSNPLEQRVATQFELVSYLLQRHATGTATAELIALESEGPQDVHDQLRLGNLLLQVNEPARAQRVFDEVVANDAANAEGWLGAGRASRVLGNYAEAERQLANATRAGGSIGSQANDELAIVRDVLRLDPDLRPLSHAKRARRVATLFDMAVQRLTSCATERRYHFDNSGQPNAPNTIPAPAPLQVLYVTALQKKGGATESALRRDSDSIDSTIDFVFQLTQTADQFCPAISPRDRALSVLAKQASEEQR